MRNEDRIAYMTDVAMLGPNPHEVDSDLDDCGICGSENAISDSGCSGGCARLTDAEEFLRQLVRGAPLTPTGREALRLIAEALDEMLVGYGVRTIDLSFGSCMSDYCRLAIREAKGDQR